MTSVKIDPFKIRKSWSEARGEIRSIPGCAEVAAMTNEVVPVESKPMPSLFPSEHEWKMLKEQATLAVKSGLLPTTINTVEKAIVIALKGRELGIPPLHALSHIYIVQGKPGASAELMLSLIYKNTQGAVIDYIETSDQVCTIEARRPGCKAVRFTFSLADAERAKLTAKDSWRSYPGAMLRARAISMMARAVFPDAIMGCSYTPEELEVESVVENTVSNAAPIAQAEAPKITVPPAENGKRKELSAAIMKIIAELPLKEQLPALTKIFCGKAPKGTMSDAELTAFLEWVTKRKKLSETITRVLSDNGLIDQRSNLSNEFGSKAETSMSNDELDSLLASLEMEVGS